MTVAFFSNGAEGDLYRERWCERCVHDENNDCPVWGAHLLYSYRDANDDSSILHLLIPRSKDGLDNEQCKMFVQTDNPGAKVDDQYRLWLSERDNG